jgi:hypothetical protein
MTVCVVEVQLKVFAFRVVFVPLIRFDEDALFLKIGFETQLKLDVVACCAGVFVLGGADVVRN